ncbi:MAG: hypothetical protein C0596_12480 [Marinilabiliales bacterium]|nr:MAG: hypothetical protein C0596_12480 [Marinilabiliales bacterium]
MVIVSTPNDPITEIKSEVKNIDGADFERLQDSLGLFGIYSVPSYYGGLSPMYKMASVYQQIDYDYEGDCLNFSGGMMPLCVNILIFKGGEYNIIDSKDELRETFAPIESEEEALSYVCAYTNTYPMYEFDLPFRYRRYVWKLYKSHAKKVEGGYEVLTYDYQTFGCGPHNHYSIVSFVDFNGNVSLLKQKKVYADPLEDGLCVD